MTEFTSSEDHTPSDPDVTVESSPKLRLPGTATALLTISPLLLFLGSITFLATQPRGYFENAATQAMVGIMIFGVVVAFLLVGLVLVGVRGIAQQHLDMLRTGRR